MNISGIKKRISEGSTCRELIEDCIKNIKEKDRGINSFITVLDEDAIKRAGLLDSQKSSYCSKKLFGVPVAVKDNICMKDCLTTCGSAILKDYKPPYNARVVEKLFSAGAVIVGKTNMDEFAMGSSTETSFFGPTKNPVDIKRIPGGSSGGSAAAVASGFVPVSLGSDTGGSIRQPASMCGVLGMKPTYGGVSRYGLIAFASSLDQIGPFASNITDTALLLEVLSGHDPKDSTSALYNVPEYSKKLVPELKDCIVGIPEEYFISGIEEDVKKCVNERIDRLGKLGVRIKRVSLPHTEYAVSTYYIIAPSEASSNLARYDGVKYGVRAGVTDRSQTYDLTDTYFKTRGRGFGAEVKRRIMLGTYALSAGYYDAYYLKAQKVRRMIAEDFKRVFNEVDLIITPTSPTTAFSIGERLEDPIKMYLSDVFTISANLAGIPGISLPCGRDSKGLPVGLQVLGRAFGEQRILDFCFGMEKEGLIEI